MLLASLVSVSLLAAQVPESPPPADPTTEAPAEVEGPAPAPAAPAPAGPPAGAPLPPRFRGVGLAITAGVVGGLGLVSNIARIAIVKTGCKADGTVQQSISDCVTGLGSYLGLSVAAPFVNLAATGLAGGAGSVAGRYQAWKTAYDGGRERASMAYIGSGAGLLGAGFVVYVVTRIMLFRDAYGLNGCNAKNDLTDDCLRGRWAGWLTGITFGQSMVVTGTGLLAFGVSYSGARRYFPARTVRMQVDPILSPTWAGLGLRGSF